MQEDPSLPQHPIASLDGGQTRRPRLEAERLDRLLEAAADMFIAQGFDATNTSEIARRVSASKTTLYSRFPTKEHLFLAVVEHRMRKVFCRVHSALPLESSVASTLRQFGAGVLAVSLSPEQAALIKVIGMEAHRFPELGRRFYELGPGRGQEALTRYIAEHVRRGTLRAIDPSLMAEHFLGLLIGGSLLWYVLGVRDRMPDAAEQGERVEAAVDAFLEAYAI